MGSWMLDFGFYLLLFVLNFLGVYLDIYFAVGLGG